MTEEAKTVKELCEEYGLRQADIVKRFGVPTRTVQDWYHGRSKPPAYVARMMDEILKNEKE